MNNLRRPKLAAQRGRPRGPATVLLPVKMVPEQRRRFKAACAEEGQTYAEFIIEQLDKRDRALAAHRRAQAHPLHQPTRKSAYPGGGV